MPQIISIHSFQGGMGSRAWPPAVRQRADLLGRGRAGRASGRAHPGLGHRARHRPSDLAPYGHRPGDREDEIGILASTFNAMTAKLRETLQSLLDYLEQVKVVMSAAAAVEEDRFEPTSLDGLAQRQDALGQLARVFQKMAREVRLREEKLKQQVRELRIVLDEARQQKKVAEITETQYFKDLQSEAESLRNIIAGASDEHRGNAWPWIISA